jgi:DNA polymerase III subunit epsilon
VHRAFPLTLEPSAEVRDLFACNVHEAVFAFVDFEFTGLDPARDRVVEVCIERVRAGELLGRIDSLVNPAGEFHGPSMAIHKIGSADLATAPQFLQAEFARLSPELTPALDSPIAYLDTLTLARRCFLQDRYSLDELCTQLKIERRASHRAGDDVFALRALFARILEALQPATVADLRDVRVQDTRPREDILAQLTAAHAGATELSISYRPSGKKPVALRAFVLAIAADHSVVTCRDARNFSRYELRIARILAVSSLLND